MVDVCDGYTAMFVTDRDERAAWIDKNLPQTVYERPENNERFYVRFGDDDEEMLYRMRWPLLGCSYSGIEYERGTNYDILWPSAQALREQRKNEA
jgi:hypothetical protein